MCQVMQLQNPTVKRQRHNTNNSGVLYLSGVMLTCLRQLLAIALCGLEAQKGQAFISNLHRPNKNRGP